MFRKRKSTDYEEAPAVDERPDAVAYRTWYGPARALTTLLGAAAAVVLIWLATQVGGDASNAEYWAGFGLIALAGLAMAFSQLLGGWTKFGVPRISGNVLLLAFVPTLIVAGWILVAHQPDSELFRNDIRGWSDDMGLLGSVMDFASFLPALAFLIGLTFGFSFDTSGPRTPAPVGRDRAVADRRVDGPVAVPAAQTRHADERTRVDGPVAVPAAQTRHTDERTTVDGPVAVPAAQTRAADEPATAERHETETHTERRGFFGRRRQRQTEYSGTAAAPQPEPRTRRTDDLD